MNTQIVRFAATATLALTAFAAAVPLAGSAHAAAGDGDTDGRDFLAWQRGVASASENSHPDFAWFPTAKPSGNRLYVGGLSYDTSSSNAQFNPKEIAVSKSVPWQP